MKLIILPFAEQDIRDSVEFYKDQDVVLVRYFITVLDQALKIIKENPNSFPIVYKNIRKFSVGPFPFNIYYILDKQSMFIIAVFHTKRNPGAWKTRKKN
jgi:plasmid stabilization system protein ParE